MSLFDTDLITRPLIFLDEFTFKTCTNPYSKNRMWVNAFDLNFSKRKLNKHILELIKRSGDKTISYDESLEIVKCITDIRIPIVNYKFIVFICLYSSSSSEIQQILNDCLSRRINKQSTPIVKVYDDYSHKHYIVFDIFVNTVYPQQIKILLKRR